MEHLSKAQLEELAQFDSPTICNAIERFKIRPQTSGHMAPGMTLRTGNSKSMVGYAMTAKVSGYFPDPMASDMLMGYYEAIREMTDPTIAVIQDIDPIPMASFWGEVQATTHMALGAVGTITDGGVRDLKEVSELGFYLFSTVINVAHGYTHIEKYNCPVSILGLTVKPGDLLHADCHGVTNIPIEIAADLAQACREVTKAELYMLEPCRAAIKEGRKPTMDNIREWRKTMVESRDK